MNGRQEGKTFRKIHLAQASCLPATALSVAETASPWPDDQPITSGTRNVATLSGAFVMVIDDSPTVRTIVEMCLCREGFEVKGFPDGVEALRWLTEPERGYQTSFSWTLAYPNWMAMKWHVASKRSHS